MGRKSAKEESDRNRIRESRMVTKLPNRRESSAKSDSEKKSKIKNSTDTADYDLTEKYKCLETKARIAINDKKIFIIIGGYDVIRNCLLERGWIEKFPDCNIPKNSSDNLLKEANDGNMAEKLLLSQMTRNTPSYFIWQPKHYQQAYNIYYPYRNRINRLKSSDFTLKEGLNNLVENIHWSIIEHFTEINYPRTYMIDRYNQEAFLNDFKFTYSTNFITFLYSAKNFSEFFSEDGNISTECITFAIQRVDFAIKAKEHFFIDTNKSFDFFRQDEMQDKFDLVMNYNYKFKIESVSTIERLRKAVDLTASNIFENWPQRMYDGFKNAWILKPSNRSRGYGIVVMDNEHRIIEYIQRHNENKYLVQKYVERPLLIYKTKFDIRQYFLTTINNNNINVFMYKNCYIKFAGQEFSLSNYHESVHLTNHSIQQYYRVSNTRNEKLPTNNMWTKEEFLNYLKLIGKFPYWDEHIYPSMRKNILAVTNASLEDTELEMNTFELNGADFLLSYDFDVLLLEINATPDLSYSTSVTENICRRVMEDIVKVVVDYSNDQNASIGDFELVYQFPISKIESSNRLQLNIEGKRLSLFHKPFKLFKIQNFSDLFVKGSKLNRQPVSATSQRNLSAEKITSRYKVKSKRRQSQTAESVARKEKEKVVRKNLETVLIQPQSSEVNDYVKSLSSFLRTSSETYINLNDLKKCLRISGNEDSDLNNKRFMGIRNDIDIEDFMIKKSPSFISL